MFNYSSVYVNYDVFSYGLKSIEYWLAFLFTVYILAAYFGVYSLALI
jgi:hypothetical protein